MCLCACVNVSVVYVSGSKKLSIRGLSMLATHWQSLRNSCFSLKS